jgi:hypothetical protein
MSVCLAACANSVLAVVSKAPNAPKGYPENAGDVSYDKASVA